MKGSSYRDRDYAFGQAMLTLRSAIGLTQAGLADFLGVSRRAVGDWEAGSSYPKPEHLKQFIVLAIEHRAYPAGREEEEIRALWQASRQKIPLDETWVGALVPSGNGKENGGIALSPAPSVDGPRLDWGEALAVPNFYGREWELNLLTEWLVEERCRMVSVLGLGGIGKSALVIHLMHQVGEHFDVVIWRSLRDLLSCEVLLDDLLQVLAPQTLGQVPASLEQRQSVLLECMRSNRLLLVLDNLESVLEEGELAGRMLPGYEGFGRFLRQSSQTEHQSCLLLTSREKPGDLAPLEGSRVPVRALRLAPLEPDACEQLLADKDVTGTESERAQLIEMYAGNPLALKIVAQTIIDLFDGEIAPFLEQGEVIFGGVRELLSQQFARLSALEQCVLLWLAIMREPSTLDELLAVLVTPLPRAQVLEAIEALRRRSLIERGQKQGSFTLQSVVLEYATARIIAEATDEIREGRPARLIEHGLELAHAREYVRQIQERLIVAPILARLRSAYPQQATVEEQLLALLTQLTTWADYAQGYGPANLVALLRLQRGNLRGLDLSRLTLRGAYLQSVEMQDATLAGAVITASMFTETFDVLMAVAVSNGGEFWAVSSLRGELRVWEAGGQILRRTWQGHTDAIWSIAFSPDGSRLASGSWDGTVKLWDVANGALLWSGGHAGNVKSVAFAPDGSRMASAGNDATVRFWDPQTGMQLDILPHPVPVLAAVWSPDGRLLASSDLEGTIRLWQLSATGSPICVQTLTGHANWVGSLAFAPDGSALASAGWDGRIRLWDISAGHVRQTLIGQMGWLLRLAWSPDGNLLASASLDHTIWLWEVEQGRHRATLQEHTAGVNGLTFTAEGDHLLSASEDGTLRLWEVASDRCVRVLQGHTTSLYDVDWSPDGARLASVGTDMLVTIYATTGQMPHRVLRGHSDLTVGVAWSPDGRLLASSDLEGSIRLWDASSGDCLQVLHYPEDSGNTFYGLAWSPDGRLLAAGTYQRGVLLWDMTANRPGGTRPVFPTWIRRVAWSPDSAQVVGGGDDGKVYVWDTTDGVLVKQLVGHCGMVTSVAWSPDGRRLASGGSGPKGGELIVWDVHNGERLMNLEAHSGVGYSVVWGAIPELVVSGGSDGTLRWWDTLRGGCVRIQKAHQGKVLALRRGPNGTKLASCGDDGAVMLWDLKTGEHLQTLRRDRPYERLNITGIRGLSEAQKATLRALGAFEETRNGA